MAETITDPAKRVDDSFAALLQEQEQRDFREGAILDAMVVKLDGNRVNLDAGLKSPSRIPLEEFRDDNGELTIKANDFVKVKVELLDDGRGNTRLSHLQYRRDLAWAKLITAHEKGETIEGVVRERVKGGYSVHINGLRAFLPGSLVDLFPTKREDMSLIGRVETFYVERLKEESMSAILNRRLVRERELAGGDFDNITFKVGDVFAGKVVAMVDYPNYIAYVHIGDGYHGRLHRDDLSWHRIGNISDVLEIDQDLKVAVLEIDRVNNGIKLSVKELMEDPWDQIEIAYPSGTKLFGKVTMIKEYGAFVEIEKGVEGLVHASEMDWSNRSNVQPAHHVTAGEEIEVMMLECNREQRRISLSIKQCRPNPWEEFNVSYRNGSKLRGKVMSVKEDLGLFVELPEGLTGLVHISNLSYTDSWHEEMAKYKEGQEIDVYLMEVNLEKQRVALGIKQLGTDPFETYEDKRNSGELFNATVCKVSEKSAVVRFADGVEAIIPIGEISEERIETLADHLKINQEVKVRIIKIEKGRTGKDGKEVDRRKIIVSMKVSKGKGKGNESTVKEMVDPAMAEVTAKRASRSFGAMVSQTLTTDTDEVSGVTADDSASTADTPADDTDKNAS